MSGVTGVLGTIVDVLIVVVGFGLIIVVHELGHFLAAKWAGIRVMAFAVGFGKAAWSYRKGLGWRRGSSEREYLKLVAQGESGEGASAISPTEYRLNWLPLGGYVKMLGQDDFDPSYRSTAPDSYQSCPPWKRMVVISAGVIFNLILAATLFIVVFMIGLKSEPAKVGAVMPGSPAARATPVAAGAPVGLQAGDEIVSVNGRRPRHFQDVVLAVVMTGRSESLGMEVRRNSAGPGESPRFETVAYSLKPTTDPTTRLLEIGVTPAISTRVVTPRGAAQKAEFERAIDLWGLQGVEPGMRLVRAAGHGDLRDAQELLEIVDRSEGRPVELVFESDDGRRVVVTQTPRAELSLGIVTLAKDREVALEHVAGFTPVMTVAEADEKAQAKGLRTGDVFARLGAVEYPSIAAGMAEIQARKGESIKAVVLRRVEGTVQEVELDLAVNSKGQIGFSVGDTALDSTLVSRAPESLRVPEGMSGGLPGKEAGLPPGSRIVRIGGREVRNFGEMREALTAAAQGAPEEGETWNVEIEYRAPARAGTGEAGEPRVASVAIGREDAANLRGLGWSLPMSIALFEMEQTLVKGEHPFDAIAIGLGETKRVMITTYLTFARLIQGTVRVEHLKGPVGIAHLGTRILDRGFIWLLFFFALISVNLAVINFLPLPIVDGGQFLMLLYEQARGRPVPVGVQNAVSLAGLALIGTMFLVVTYNDIVGLFGG